MQNEFGFFMWVCKPKFYVFNCPFYGIFKKQILTNLLKRKKKYINILRFKKKKLTNKRTYGFLVNNVLKCFKNNNYKSLHELHLGRNGY